MWSTHSCTHWEDVQIQHDTSASCAQAGLQPWCLLLWSWGWPLLTEVGGPWVFVQSKAPFSSYKAFMNTHLPPLLTIPLTAALLLPSPSFPPFLFFFFVLQTPCPYVLPAYLTFTHTLTSNRFLPFTLTLCACASLVWFFKCPSSTGQAQCISLLWALPAFR